MSDNQANVRHLIVSGVIALPLFVAGWILMPTEGSWGAVSSILGGLLCFLLGAVVLAIPLAGLFAEPWGSLYFPKGNLQAKAPMYGIPQAKRKKGLFEESMADYEAITRDHPGELRAYVEMMDMAVVDLNDPSRAECIYEQGLLTIQNEDDRRSLGVMYRAIASRHLSRFHQSKKR